MLGARNGDVQSPGIIDETKLLSSSTGEDDHVSLGTLEGVDGADLKRVGLLGKAVQDGRSEMLRKGAVKDDAADRYGAPILELPLGQRFQDVDQHTLLIRVGQTAGCGGFFLPLERIVQKGERRKPGVQGRPVVGRDAVAQAARIKELVR